MRTPTVVHTAAARAKNKPMTIMGQLSGCFPSGGNSKVSEEASDALALSDALLFFAMSLTVHCERPPFSEVSTVSESLVVAFSCDVVVRLLDILLLLLCLPLRLLLREDGLLPALSALELVVAFESSYNCMSLVLVVFVVVVFVSVVYVVFDAAELFLLAVLAVVAFEAFFPASLSPS